MIKTFMSKIILNKKVEWYDSVRSNDRCRRKKGKRKNVNATHVRDDYPL